MERKRIIAIILLLAPFWLLNSQTTESKQYFEKGTLMALTKNYAVIDELKLVLDKNAQIVDITGMKVPIDMVKLPALCKFQTNLMTGEESNTVKIVKIVILKPIKASEFHRKFLKKE